MKKSVFIQGLFLLFLLLPAGGLFAADKDQAPGKEVEKEKGETPVTSLDITWERPAPPAFNEFNLEKFTGLDVDMTLHGDLFISGIWNNNLHFNNDEKAGFAETYARVGADFAYGDNLSASFRVVAADATSRAEKWTMPERNDWGIRPDIANISLHGALWDLDSTLTVGLQELSYGDGLLIDDGYSDRRAVWSNAIRSFPAIRWRVGVGPGYTLDLFTAMVHDDYLNYEGFLGDRGKYRSYAAYIANDRFRVQSGGQVSGADFKVLSDTFGEIDAGLFFKDDQGNGKDDPHGRDAGSNTWAASLRDAVTVDPFRATGPFTVTGEIVKQWGRTNVVENVITNDSHRRSAMGGQVSLRFDFTRSKNTPYIKGRWAQFQGDNPSSRTVESFDPFFSGNRDWGEWYLGDITSYYYPNTNKRAISVEFGLVPVEKTRVRLIYYDISFDQKLRSISGSPQWSNELNLVVDYAPCDYGTVGFLVGAASPGGAAEKFYGDNKTQTEVAAWIGFSF